MVPFLQAALSLFGMGQYATHHATRAVYATTGVMQVSLLSLGALTFDSEDATFKKIKKSKVKAVATLGAVALSFLGLGCLVELSTGYSQFMGAAITVLGFGGIRNLVLPTMEEYTMEHVISKEPAKIVCQVLHKATSRRFAMKIYDTALMDVHRLNALRVELNTLLPINHPNLINVHDINVEDGLCYVVCDLEEGDDLFDVLLRKPPLASYGPQVDVWSLGVVAYVLLSGAFPFSGSTQTDLFDAIQAGIIDMPDVSAPAKRYISNMLTVDPTQRGGVTARRYATASGVDVSLTFYSKEMMAFEDEVDLHAHVDVLRQLAHHGNIANLHEFYSDCYEYCVAIEHVPNATDLFERVVDRVNFQTPSNRIIAIG
ncbi:hypothetical protein DYB30_005649 [Aphanomyces astaci]|uniref:Protein kinase domain-containing protein n=1 Tax=Aphanomyces astaci TaxID=112090 RepID=A0A397DMA8_APHAT|nr:hypothetical protein DYB30_005649 [Aphanomyces astaci]